MRGIQKDGSYWMEECCLWYGNFVQILLMLESFIFIHNIVVILIVGLVVSFISFDGVEFKQRAKRSPWLYLYGDTTCRNEEEITSINEWEWKKKRLEWRKHTIKSESYWLNKITYCTLNFTTTSRSRRKK